WNNDTTRLPARLHADFLDLIEANPFVHPGRLELRGTPLDMRLLDLDSYVVAGLTDHITPWQGCYNTAKLYGERSTFLLANSGDPRPSRTAPSGTTRAPTTPPATPRGCWGAGGRGAAGARWGREKAANPGGGGGPRGLAGSRAPPGPRPRARAALGGELTPPLE